MHFINNLSVSLNCKTNRCGRMGVGGLKCYVKNIITHTGASHTPKNVGGGGGHS